MFYYNSFNPNDLPLSMNSGNLPPQMRDDDPIFLTQEEIDAREEAEDEKEYQEELKLMQWQEELLENEPFSNFTESNDNEEGGMKC